jgi:hypothetical protein
LKILTCRKWVLEVFTHPRFALRENQGVTTSGWLLPLAFLISVAREAFTHLLEVLTPGGGYTLQCPPKNTSFLQTGIEEVTQAMNTKANLPDPQHVLDLRIHLAQNQVITWQQLSSIADYDLTCYMITQPGFPEQDLSEEDGLHWNCRDLAKWMKEHPQLFDLYVQGKAIKNPSGRTCEINQGYRPGRI